ncbi:hypothetical protein BKA70DRAFT_1503143 [Coprinopsis sp. MPI-PUGE-AT-0042]|nr:hypothetical protein BKA70DRAFT_1503143 [Coprinopsis sp. MPI-PUGE-AT-0042]
MSQGRVPLSPRKISFGLGKPTSPPTTLETIPSRQVPNITRIMSPDSTRTTTSPPPTGPTGVVPGVGLRLRRLTGSRSAVDICDCSDSNSSWEEAAEFRPPPTGSTTFISRPIPVPRLAPLLPSKLSAAQQTRVLMVPFASTPTSVSEWQAAKRLLHLSAPTHLKALQMTLVPLEVELAARIVEARR